MVLEKLKKYRDIFKSPMSGYFKPFDNAKTKKDDPRLKKNEQDFIKKISPYLVWVKILKKLFSSLQKYI